MILTGAKFEEFGKALYGEVWVSVMARKLKRNKRFIMRLRDRPGLPASYQRVLMDLIDEQFAELGEIRAQLEETFADAA